MNSFRKELWMHVQTRRAFVNITPQVEQSLRESGIREGLCLVNSMHITSSVFINDDERGLHLDFGPWEQIFYGEFDGQRRKRVLVKIIGE
jgi:thiamine phosphate synthase YjbQ (UPF0047 family)